MEIQERREDHKWNGEEGLFSRGSGRKQRMTSYVGKERTIDSLYHVWLSACFVNFNMLFEILTSSSVIQNSSLFFVC